LVKDPFGNSLLAWHRRRDDTPHLVLRDDGYRREARPSRYFTGPEDWDPVDRQVLKYARGSVLDVGAGAGRHSLWLQHRGHSVTAIDNSPGAVLLLRERGVRIVRRMDARFLRFPRASFDTALLMFNNFGLAGSFDRTRKLLKDLHSITTERGRVIATTRHPLPTVEPEHLAYHARNRKRGLPIGLARLSIRYQRARTGWFGLYMPTARELARLLRESGWRIARRIGPPSYFGVVLEKSDGIAVRSSR
jgi:SAM-dependent methyltransferase